MLTAMESEQLVILLIGNGGREHALAWKLSQSPRVAHIFAVPGNGGTAQGLSKVMNISHVKPDDYPGLVAFARDHKVNLVVPGPEAPLVDGVEGYFRVVGIPFFGPSKAAARMEGSKSFSKDFMARHNIPTARYQNFNDYEAAKKYLEVVPYRVVLKASGLAGGKGVILPSSKEDCQKALKDIMLNKEFGTAGDEVVIEEYLEGEELSFLSFSDGYTIRSLPPAQDHKQVFNNDEGPNTGGMGCYAPSDFASQALIADVHKTILQPTIDGMRNEGFPFVGMLFTGLMITKDGPKTLEYNVRFGDPETQTLLPLLKTDLSEIMIACTERWLSGVTVEVNVGYAATVVASADGYPGKYKTGEIIECAGTQPGTMVFHAGTSFESGTIRSTGGRVIAATSIAPTLENAIARAYSGMGSIKFTKMHFRTDIGHRALKRARISPADQAGYGPSAYDLAGVSISSGNNLVKRIKPMVAATAVPGTSADIGGFGGVFDLELAGYAGAPTLVSANDGVGTKLMIAHVMNIHDTVGIDLVAMSVNDLVVQGAKPLFFLDCFTCSKLIVDIAADFVRGVCTGCVDAGCSLIGGETAEMPGLFPEDASTYDVVGSATGAIPRGQKILPDTASMKEGDILLGLASKGCHSNGFSLIRKIVEKAGLSYHDRAPWESTEKSVGESLLTPTKIYVNSVLKIVNKNLVKGMAHITGGGLVENIPRMLPDHLQAEVNCKTWPVPQVFKWLKKTGELENEEFARVFNTGLGMVAVVAVENVDEAFRQLESAGEQVYVVGKLSKREGDEGVVLLNLEQAW